MAHMQDLVRSASVTMKSGKPAECAKRFASCLARTAALLLALYFFICRLFHDSLPVFDQRLIVKTNSSCSA